VSLIQELKRRNVFKVGAAYVVMAWLIAQGVDVFLENFGAPDWVIKTILLLLIAGFPIALFFAWAFELTPDGIKKEKDVDRSQSITSETGRKLDYTIIAVLLIALTYFAYDKFGTDGAGSGAEITVESAGQAAINEKSIAVLPFVNMSDDASNEYFSDGISEEILNALARVNELQVAGRTSSFAFKGENQDLRVIGEALGVNHILEGSVRKAGNKVRITAQLIQVDNGFHLWSDSYDRELTDVFAIQDEISNAILEQLKARLIDGGSQVVESQRTSSEAYDLYLLAKQRMYERTQLPLESAAELLDRAIAIDPDYAPAWAQRAIVVNLLDEVQYGTIPHAQAITLAKQYTDKALELDPELAEGWAAMGLYYQDRPGGTEQSMEALEKALSINPGMINAANWLSAVYMNLGQPAKSIALLEDIMQRDPLYRPGLANLTFQYLATGQPSKAKVLMEKARPFIPQDANIISMDAWVKLWSESDVSGAWPLLEEALRQQPNDRVNRTEWSHVLRATHQYQRLAEEGIWNVRIIGLQHMGRIEEATLLAQRWAADGEIVPYLTLLNTSGQSENLVNYLEERWPTPADFEADFHVNGYVGYGSMIQVALAYRRVGNQAKFEDAMARIRTAHDSLAEQGLNNKVFFTNEAAYYAMADDREQALKFLAAAIDNGEIFASRISDDLPFFADYNGDPDYEAIQARMIENLERERAALGLEPLST